MKRKITFKEIQKVEELEQCLKLRYDYFNNPQYKVFLNGNKSGIDLDEFDKFGRHWVVVDETNEIIGYARVIQRKTNAKVLPLIQQIKSKYLLCEHSVKNGENPFPMMIYQTCKSKSFLTSFLSKNTEKEVFELSRFIIKKGSSFRISKFMVNAGLGIYKHCFQAKTVILACNENHEKFWRQYGFRNIKEQNTYMVDQLSSVNLFSRLDGINPTIINRFEDFSGQYKKEKKISIEI